MFGVQNIMVNTRSVAGDEPLRNDRPEHRPPPGDGPITREEIATMMQTLLAQQREETKLLLQQHAAQSGRGTSENRT